MFELLVVYSNMQCSMTTCFGTPVYSFHDISSYLIAIAVSWISFAFVVFPYALVSYEIFCETVTLEMFAVSWYVWFMLKTCHPFTCVIVIVNL